MNTPVSLNIWEAIFYTCVVVFLSFSYFFALNICMDLISKDLFNVLELIGPLIYFSPLIIYANQGLIL